jgi:hypothetical protein
MRASVLLHVVFEAKVVVSWKSAGVSWLLCNSLTQRVYVWAQVDVLDRLPRIAGQSGENGGS